MAKTKIFWIAKKTDDTMQMWAFNNKRKAEDKGVEVFGVGITDFSFNLDGEEFEDEDGFTAYISSGQIDSFGHFLLYRADAMPHAIGLEQEQAAIEYVEAELPYSAGACFPAKLKGGSCDVYMSSAVEANGALWTFEDGEVNEKVSFAQMKKDSKTKEYLAVSDAIEGAEEVSDIWNMLEPEMFEFTEKEFEDIFHEWWNLQMGYDSVEDFGRNASFEDAHSLYLHLLPHANEKLKKTSTEMKYIKLFEEFINEAANLKKATKELQDDNYLNDFATVTLEDGVISVEMMDGENPWGDDGVVTFYWDGKMAWCEGDFSSSEYEEPVTSVSDFRDALISEEGWVA
jgi:hypothetical protein